MSKVFMASVAGLGTAAAGGGFYLLKDDLKSSPAKATIRDKLKEERFEILDSNSPSWESVRTQYNSSRSTSSKAFLTHSKDIEVGELKKLCEDNLSKDEFDPSLYSKVKRWCITPVTVSKHLEKWSMTSLPTDNTQNSKQAEWTKLAEKYDSATNKISGLATLETKKWENLASKCKEIGDKKNHDDDFDSSVESYKVWCTEEGVKSLN
ncbi:hypothetical protein MHF_0984 [Mycoplasma haemofelis Ohio2]|uniref:Uncharacterized protein n=1 Tax=Mycoplasma haemofelis (strain Ohio2) TaxID=859194 RepID=F6FJ41_MYCHI|nr:hypothetical protein MHF_0984 [Mycoplasma haemofelis Ohio2]